MSGRHLAAAALLVCSLLASGARSAQPPSFPADVTLTQVLGFRPKPGLEETFVIKGKPYLAKGTKVRLLDSKPAFGSAGAYCRTEALGHKGYLRCDKPEAFKFARAASPKQQAPAGKHATLGAYCSGVEDCRAFCEKSCKLDLAKWHSTCKFPAGLGGSIPEGSPLLKKLPKMKSISGESGVRANAEVIAGLQRLDDYIASSSSWPKGHTVFVHSCYRSDRADSTSECDYILKGWHIKSKWADKKPSTKQEINEKATGDRLIDPPRNLGLMWPGATPHSAGLGCDLVLRDQGGKEVTTCKMKDNPKQKAASKTLVEALTSDAVGAVRLNYEGWHFEWGGAIASCRCKGAECNEKHWPTPCDGGQHCAQPK